MRNIEVSIDVFSRLWSVRRPGENTENEILARILAESSAQAVELKKERNFKIKVPATDDAAQSVEVSKQIRPLLHSAWWEVIRQALDEIGGEGNLPNIYRQVVAVCRLHGRRIPKTIEETVRGTLEDNCSDSERYKGVRDVFWMPRGKGEGYWGLRHPR